jgi:hypothetical protein
MLFDDVGKDPMLGAKRNQLIMNAVRRLVEARMVNWNTPADVLRITDLGRIAAKYYIRIASVEIFNERFRSKMSEADALRVLSYSTEVGWFRPSFSMYPLTPFCVQFNQIQLRESEVKELEALEKKVPCEVKVWCWTLRKVPPLIHNSGWNYRPSREGQHFTPVLHLAIPRGRFCSSFGPGIYCAERWEDYPRIA